METQPVAGKYLLEILTKGMYSNPLHVYREYIQNSADSIDRAITDGLLPASDAAIHIQFSETERKIVIRDNGVGLSAKVARSKLMDIGASDKDGISERGFRGIGRLAGLAYAEEVVFTTSSAGEKQKTVMTCDGTRLARLLQKSNTETRDLMETFQAVTRFDVLPEEENLHYFEVRLHGVSQNTLLKESEVKEYLEVTAPVDFNDQQFMQHASKIREHFDQHGCPIVCYKILRGERTLPIYKTYSRALPTGNTARTKGTDYIRDIEFFHAEAPDGKPLYRGWLAISDFSGSISDKSVHGIRFRKGNILVGDSTTFCKYFPSEGHTANRMFAGEIHVLHPDIIPNSQRDDFEPNETCDEMYRMLSAWAKEINKKYRRGTSAANSALRKLDSLNKEQEELEKKISSGAITSDEKREQLAEQLDKIKKDRQTAEKHVRKAFDEGRFDAERKSSVEKTLSCTASAARREGELSTQIANADYATKNDLPSSYNRGERKLYQRIITVIDDFFANDPETAEKLREAIKSALQVKKK